MQSFIQSQQAELARLHHLVGSHMREMDRILSKINGKPLHASMPTVAKSHHSLINKQALLKSLTRQRLQEFTGASFNNRRDSEANEGYSYRPSQGQMFSDLAMLINKAMTRNF